MSGIYYKAFGLVFKSDIILPEMRISSGNEVNVIVSKGEVPEQIENPLKTTVRFSVSENDFILTVDRVARFRVSNGRSIIYQPDESATEDDIRLFMYGSAFAALFHQRGMMPLHASTVCNDKGAYSFSGISGAGKSSLSFLLVQSNQFGFVSDDISVFSSFRDGTYALPGIPNVKLWADILSITGEQAENYKNVRGNIQKFRVPLNERFSENPVKLNSMFFIFPQNQKEITVTRVSGMEKFNLIQANIFRSQFVSGSRLQENYFRKSSSVLQDINIFRILRPRSGMEINRLRDKVIEIIK